MTDSLIEIKGGSVEVLTPAREMFDEGRRIGLTFERGLQTAVDRFYQAAIPFAYKVKHERPWKCSEFSDYDDPDDSVALLKFLRESFSDRRDKTARQQARVVHMIVMDGLSFEDVCGAGFGHLVALGPTFDKLSPAKRKEMLVYAQQKPNIFDFRARLLSEHTGLHIEPQKAKMLTGSRSAIESINQFDEVTTQRGDSRPVAEKLGDLAQGAIYVETDVVRTHDEEGRPIPVEAREGTWDNWTISAYCRWQRRREPAMADWMDMQIIAAYCFRSMALAEDHLDEETLAEFWNIKSARPLR